MFATKNASRPVSWKRVWLFTGVAVVSNLVIFAIGSIAGADWLAQGQTLQAIGWYFVVGASVVPLLIAAVVTALLARVWRGAPLVLAWVGLAFGVLTAPAGLLAAPQLGTGIALASMHIVAGIAWFMAIRPRAAA